MQDALSSCLRIVITNCDYTVGQVTGGEGRSASATRYAPGKPAKGLGGHPAALAKPVS
jgi:hypothetical protein